jgi:hypothetical protein
MPIVARLAFAAVASFAVLPILACGGLVPGPSDHLPGPVRAPATTDGFSSNCQDPTSQLFFCNAPGGPVTVCGSPEGDPWMRVVLGPPEQPRMVFPDSRDGSSFQFRVEERTLLRAQGTALVFSIGPKNYEIIEMAGSGEPDGEMNNFTGLVVLENEIAVEAVTCAGPVVSRWPQIHQIVDPISP